MKKPQRLHWIEVLQDWHWHSPHRAFNSSLCWAHRRISLSSVSDRQPCSCSLRLKPALRLLLQPKKALRALRASCKYRQTTGVTLKRYDRPIVSKHGYERWNLTTLCSRQDTKLSSVSLFWFCFCSVACQSARKRKEDTTGKRRSPFRQPEDWASYIIKILTQQEQKKSRKCEQVWAYVY